MLDAHIRQRTNGKKSMDDVIRLEYKRWSGAHGYTGGEFNQTVSDAAGVDVAPLLHTLDRDDRGGRLLRDARLVRAALHAEADPAKAWTLEVRPDATAAQQRALSPPSWRTRRRGSGLGAILAGICWERMRQRIESKPRDERSAAVSALICGNPRSQQIPHSPWVQLARRR